MNELLINEKSKLIFRKKTKINLDKPVSECSWAELHDLRSKTQTSLEKLIEFAEKEKREISDEENTAFTFGDALITEVNEEFSLRERLGTREPIDRTKPINPFRFPDYEGDVNFAGSSKVNFRSYKGMFGSDLNRNNFKTPCEEFRVVLSGKYDPRLEKRLQTITSGVQGGYALSSETAALLLDTALEEEIIRPRARVFPMKGDSLQIPAWKAADHRTSALYGGFSMEWLAENEAGTIQTAALRLMTLSAGKCGLYGQMSRELLSDEPRFQNWLQIAMIKAISHTLDDAFINGNGVAKPLGILNSPSKINVSRAIANQIAFADIRKMYARLAPAFHKNAVWLCSVDALPQLMGVVDTAGNALFYGGGTSSISNPLPQFLYGKPLIVSERVPSLGSTGDLTLVDLTQYAIGLREDIYLAVTDAYQFTQDVITIKVLMRLDGQSLWDKAITPTNSSDSLNWCVALA